MSFLYVKQIEKPNEREWFERGKVTNLINEKKIYLVNSLDINILGGYNKYSNI